MIIAASMAMDYLNGGDYTDTTLIAKTPLGTVVDGPMYLHTTEESANMLTALGFHTETMQKEISVGHMTQNEDGSWDPAEMDEFRGAYYRHSRFKEYDGSIPSNVMNGNQGTFIAWDVDWKQVTDRLLAIIRQAGNTTIILDEMQHIDNEGIFTRLGSFIPRDNIISTIPRIILEKALVNNPQYEMQQIPDTDKSMKVFFRIYTDDAAVMDTFRDDFTYTLPIRGGAYDRLTRVTRVPGYNNQLILEYTIPFVSDSDDRGFRQFMDDRIRWHKTNRCHDLHCVVRPVPRNANSALKSAGDICYRGRYSEWDDRIKITDILKEYPIRGK